MLGGGGKLRGTRESGARRGAGEGRERGDARGHAEGVRGRNTKARRRRKARRRHAESARQERERTREAAGAEMCKRVFADLGEQLCTLLVTNVFALFS